MRCTVQLLACRQPDTIREILGDDATITDEGHILVIGTQPHNATGLLAEMRALAQRDLKPYVVLPEGLGELAHSLQIPYVTYGTSHQAHVRLNGHQVESPLGTALLSDRPELEVLAGIAAALVLRVCVATAVHRLNTREAALTAIAA